ncbi:MAG: helix-turn-helix domain-containing protein [Lachnospiraceae bacterium]|nr:helix-turn-helix domain-containing protein [Lachnospiraceae bacterium]MCI9284185.1 helix-turn-helix domain-containing protein [Lachnospiraceae bacterium]
MGEEKYGMLVAFDTAQAAIQGDVDSINQVISYFQPYINAKSKRKFINEFGLAEHPG